MVKEEALSCAPKGFNFNPTIFMILGYDMGIAFNGNVVMNVGYSLYLENPREVLYFAIHELSHLIVYSYQPALPFSSLKTRGDLFRVLQFHTQLEGLGVFTPLRIREAELGFSSSGLFGVFEGEFVPDWNLSTWYRARSGLGLMTKREQIITKK